MSTGTPLTRENSTASRGKTDELIELKKVVGRFELTSTESSRQASVIDSLSPYSTQSSNSILRGAPSAQIVELMKQNELQKNLLAEMMQCFEPIKPTQQQQDLVVKTENV
jgi:hypothetical protein